MEKYSYTQQICVLGACFEGVEDIIKHARSGEPKDGVYVGEDSKRYPCFDSYDSMNETRSFWNFVFATTKEEMERKLAILCRMENIECNYNKLTPELSPMAYWGGEKYYDVELV